MCMQAHQARARKGDGRSVCHGEKDASGIGSCDRSAACDPFDPDGFPVCPEQESGGGEYICDHGGERRGKERLYPLGGIYRPGGSHAESIPPGHGKYPGGCSSELGGTACISRSKIRRGFRVVPAGRSRRGDGKTEVRDDDGGAHEGHEILYLLPGGIRCSPRRDGRIF